MLTSDARYEEENFYHPPVRDSLDHIDLLESVWKVLDGLAESLHLRLNIFRYRNRNGGRNALNGIFEVVDGSCKLVQPSLDILVGTPSETFEAVTGFTVAGDGPIFGTAFPFPCWEPEAPIAIGCGILFCFGAYCPCRLL